MHDTHIEIHSACFSPLPSHCYASPSKKWAVPCVIDIVLLTFPALRPNIP